jgi:hypothetical protein
MEEGSGAERFTRCLTWSVCAFLAGPEGSVPCLCKHVSPLAVSTEPLTVQLIQDLTLGLTFREGENVVLPSPWSLLKAASYLAHPTVSKVFDVTMPKVKRRTSCGYSMCLRQKIALVGDLGLYSDAFPSKDAARCVAHMGIRIKHHGMV